MATTEEILQMLAEANEQTNNIAADIQRLVNEATSLEEVQAGTQALVERLTAVAAVVPEPEPEPPV